MRRDEIEAKVMKVADAFALQAKATGQLSRGHDTAEIKASIDKAEQMIKTALLDIAVDTLYVLHRIADALEGDQSLMSKPREKL